MCPSSGPRSSNDNSRPTSSRAGPPRQWLLLPPVHEPPRSRGEGFTMAEGSPAGLQKLSPLCVRWLDEVGVRCRADLVQMGPMAAYRLIQATQNKANLRLL